MVQVEQQHHSVVFTLAALQEQFTGYLTDPARKEQWYHANKWLYMPDARGVYAALE